jgi:uncharacterized iron-regulated membrane protein
LSFRIKRSLFLVHRWLGIAMCVLFALWFATGVVMMYVEYPELTEEERFAALQPIDLSSVALPVEQAVRNRAAADAVTGITLSMLGGRPAYRIAAEDGTFETVYADTGERLDPRSPTVALDSVAHSGFATPGVLPRHDGVIDVDQWTVSAVLDEHRALHRIVVGDAAGTVLYVSSVTGQIVRDTHRAERLWNWLGSTIHWIYPFQLRRHVDLWATLVTYLSLAGVVSVVTGSIVGIMRLRIRNPYRRKGASPYRGAARWHHVLGLLGMVFVGTFIFSGLMSMYPWGIFDSAMSEAEQIRRFMGGPLALGALPPTTVAGALGGGVKEVEWRQIDGLPHVVVSRSAHDRQVAVGGSAGAAAAHELERRIAAALPRLVPNGSVRETALVEQYDDYYYSRHNRYRPLPAYRVAFDDPESTWFYVDAVTGAVVMRYTTRTRAARWLYNGLHSLDFGFLLRRGIAWDVTVIVLSVVGFVFAVTSVLVALKRIFPRNGARSGRVNAARALVSR